MKLGGLIALDVVLLFVSGWYAAGRVVSNSTPTTATDGAAWLAVVALSISLLVLLVMAGRRAIRHFGTRS